MSERHYTTMDKSDWGEGAWNDEPDKVQWTDSRTGLPCLAVRNRFGVWCGYVGVTEGHPWFECGDYMELEVEVHGGLTYADFCQEGAEERAICHVPEPGQPDRVWWLGFDCGHHCDIAPALEARDRARGWPPIRDGYERYRTLSYLRDEVESLARQVEAAGKS